MSKTQKLTATAMLAALSVVANAFSVQIYGSNYISFTYIPSFIAAIWLGVIPAAAVGFLGDLIAGLIFPHGAYNILIGISSTLIAVVPSVIYKMMPQKRRVALLLSLVVCTVVCTSGLNTYALWLMYGAKSGKTFWIYLWGRLPFQLLNTALNGAVIALLQESHALDNVFGKIIQKNKNSSPETTDFAIDEFFFSTEKVPGKIVVKVTRNSQIVKTVTITHDKRAKTKIIRKAKGVEIVITEK